jgi:hypothetical protein
MEESTIDSIVVGIFTYRIPRIYTEAAKPDYATPSKIATKLGWSTTVWDLSADAPTLK